jgi:hypothetical protein
VDLSSFPFLQAAFFAVGVALVAWGTTLHERARTTARWPSVRGRVYLTRVLEKVSDDVRDGGTRLFHPEVRYEYVVADRTYAARRLDLLDKWTSLRSYATDVIARYPEGSEVTVYYDTANPHDAVLERHQAPYWAIGGIAVGCVMALGALVSAYLETRTG